MKHHLNLLFTGMPPEPDPETKYDDHNRQTGDIGRFNKGLGGGLGLLHRVENAALWHA